MLEIDLGEEDEVNEIEEIDGYLESLNNDILEYKKGKSLKLKRQKITIEEVISDPSKGDLDLLNGFDMLQPSDSAPLPMEQDFLSSAVSSSIFSELKLKMINEELSN